MSRPAPTEHLKPDDWERLREVAEQFERAWGDNTDVDLAGFLPPPDDPLHGAILEELVKTDLEIRQGRGQGVTLDYYLEKYPRLGEARRLPARLIYEEYRVRCRFGERPDLERYRQRFPDQFAELARLIGEQSLPARGETRLDDSSPLPRPRTVMDMQNGNILPVGEGYRLIKRIGSGSFGEVWEVKMPGGFSAAVKIIRRTLDCEESQRELRALEVIKRLNHPHLLKTLAAWALQDQLVILMELAGGTLRDRLQKCKEVGAAGIPVAELLRYFQEAAEALDYLHAEGVLHRDVKPQNLLLAADHVKVADFGLVRDQNQEHPTYSTGGTPGYMAPEAWRGAACAASDQYSLALTYAELRLGRWPFDATDPLNVMLAHLQGTPDLSRLGEAERNVLLRAVAKNPAERFPTCQAFLTALRDALPGDPATHDFPAPPRFRPAPPTRPLPKIKTTERSRPAPSSPEAAPDRPSLTESLTPALPTRAPQELPAVRTLAPTEDSAPLIETQQSTGAEGEAPGAPRPPAWKRRRSPPWWAAVALLVLAGSGVVIWRLLHPAPQPATSAQPPPSPDGKGPQPERVSPPPRMVRHVGGQEVVFMLIRPDGKPDAPFYLMENKVSNRVFRAFANERPREVADPLWRRGGLANGQDARDDDGLPVFRVTRPEAERCAAWLGGRLPAARQLDLALGYDERRDRGRDPAPPRAAAVNRIQQGPRKITADSDDVSPSGIRDLAGNGREWTRDTLTSDDGKPLAVLRGRSYTAPGPLRFADLDEWTKHPEHCPVQSPEHRSWTTSFRVVIELAGLPADKSR